MSDAREGEGRNVLVTGASAGIGAALAHSFARRGFTTILTARRAHRLEALKAELESAYAVRAISIPCDLAQPDAPKEIAAALGREGLVVHALVNNAGYNLRGTMADHEWRETEGLLRVMAVAPYELTHLFLPHMRAAGYGRILNVSSVVGLLPGGVSNTLYGGVKAMQVAFSEALHVDEKANGIHVTALCPGLTYSEFHDVDGSRASLSRVPRFLWHTAESVAEAGYAALARNDVYCVPGIIYRLGIAVARIAPRSLSNAIAARIARFQR